MAARDNSNRGVSIIDGEREIFRKQIHGAARQNGQWSVGVHEYRRRARDCAIAAGHCIGVQSAASATL